jgi:hypothetical protein
MKISYAKTISLLLTLRVINPKCPLGYSLLIMNIYYPLNKLYQFGVEQRFLNELMLK